MKGKTVKILTAIQRREAQLIAGSFRITAGPAMNVKMHLLPIKLLMEKLIGQLMLRLTFNSLYRELNHVRDTAPRKKKSMKKLR